VVRVTQDSSCLRGFLWDLDHAQPPDEVLSRLRRAGWEGRCFGGVLWTWTQDHHKVLYVPSTGRLQVRVDLCTPHEQRRKVAEEVAKLLDDPVEP